MIKILLLTRMSRNAASSRYRSYQYLPFLRRMDFEIEVYPLLSEEYINVRYKTGGYSSLRTTISYLKRILNMRKIRYYDLVWVEKEAMPWLPFWVEKLLFKDIPVVVDYDDAEFHRYDNNKSYTIRLLLGRKIDKVMRFSSLVIAGNEYIANRARKAGAKRVELLPTVVDIRRYEIKKKTNNSVFTIGWIGTPITSRLLMEIRPALQEVCKNRSARLLAIGSGVMNMGEIPVEYRTWSEETEVANLMECDVGVMPLTNSKFERGKCGLKLIQYMACSIPVVGSPVGVNCDIIHNGINGYQALSNEEYINALMKLRNDTNLRIKMGQEGRKLVEMNYSLERSVPRIARLLQESASRK